MSRNEINTLQVFGETSRASESHKKHPLGIVSHVPVERDLNLVRRRHSREKQEHRVKALSLLDTLDESQRSLLEALINSSIGLGRKQYFQEQYVRGLK